MKLVSSFRDPSGFLFRKNGVLYRQINSSYKGHYKHLMESGLYKALVDKGLLVPHTKVDSCRIIKPELIPFISYPYEWCFGQLKDAALATLAIQRIALEHGMTLKDASAYNIQFRDCKPVLIDTLSFEILKEVPWVAYRQFCQHFLAPLALMSYTDMRLGQLLRVYIDGVPLDLASRLLPARTRTCFSLLTHIHLHAKSQALFGGKTVKKSAAISKQALFGLIDSLERAVKKLKYEPKGTEWSDYYSATNYSSSAARHKKEIVAAYLAKIRPESVWDFGGNTGKYSRLASDLGALTISFDIDSSAVEKNYRECVRNGKKQLLPLLLDLTNPSPAIGWANEERVSLIQRGPVDTVIALALIHHLAIANNLPLKMIAQFLRKLCNNLIIEFVPKEDSRVRHLLATREDIFVDYNQQGFEKAFCTAFTIIERCTITDSMRTMYLMEART